MGYVAPRVGEKRVAVRVTSQAERIIRGGHPWVFDGSITSVSHEADPGDLAVIFDHDRKFIAIGLWDPLSPIRVRVLHAGRPLVIDDDFWRDRVLDALSRREALLAAPEITGMRLINGENDGFPGLVADCYDDVGVLKIYSTAWLPHLPTIVESLAEVLSLTSLVVRTARLVSGADLHGLRDGMALWGELPEAPVEFLENGLLFRADVLHGQKTGHFFDHRDNRAIVRSLANGATVLDAFSGTGGFSVHAAAGGAKAVTSVDVSDLALQAAQSNLALNVRSGLIEDTRHQVIRADAFKALEAMASSQELFDLVILDPPSFAPRQANVAAALSAYGRLTRLGLDVLSPGGTLVQASCSSRVDTESFLAVVRGAAAERGFLLHDTVVTGHGIDHPVTFPEGAYLKAIYGAAVRVDV